MTERAAHLIDHVLPRVPVRQRVLSLPFELFGQHLSLAINNPSLHNLNGWLVRARGVQLGVPLDTPTGDWIICGYGRMGRWLHQYMGDHGIGPVVIDPKPR